MHTISLIVTVGENDKKVDRDCYYFFLFLGCFIQADCQVGWSCVNVRDAIYDFANLTGHVREAPRLVRKLDIDTPECIMTSEKVFSSKSPEQYNRQFQNAVKQINTILSDKEKGLPKFARFGANVTEVVTFKVKPSDTVPTFRQFATGTST